MAEIISAIIGKDFSEITKKIEQVKDHTTWVQFDIVDGIFAEPESWRTPLDLWEPLELPKKMELHMMVANPEKVVGDWFNSPIDRYLVHHESAGNIQNVIERIKEKNAEVGIVLKLESDISALEPYMEKIDLVQLMGIAQIGDYGQPFDERVVEKIRLLRENYPDVTIQIDGGVNLDNAKKIISAGANNLVIGSAIFKSGNISETIKSFQKLA